MKQPTLIVLAWLLLSCASVHAGWFGNDEAERRIEAESQLETQRQTTGRWQIVSGVLAVGCVVLFTAGASVGSTLRRRATRAKP
jgi:hypothetical protein